MLEIFISEFFEKHLEVRSIVKRGIFKHGEELQVMDSKSISKITIGPMDLITNC
jgi:hypothetical protein